MRNTRSEKTGTVYITHLGICETHVVLSGKVKSIQNCYHVMNHTMDPFAFLCHLPCRVVQRVFAKFLFIKIPVSLIGHLTIHVMLIKKYQRLLCMMMIVSFSIKRLKMSGYK